MSNANFTSFAQSLSDGAYSAGRGLAAGVTGAEMYGNSIAAVLGPLPVPGNTPGFAREGVSLQTTARAYVGQSLDIIVTTFELLLSMFPSFISRVLPMVRTNNMTIRVFKFTADRSLATHVPDFAPAPVLTQGTAEYKQTLERRAKAIEIGNGFWNTDEGKASFAMKQAMLRAVMLASMDAERYHAIFNAPHSEIYHKAILSNNGLPFNNLLDLFGNTRELFGIAHRQGGMTQLDERLKLAFDEGARPDTYLVPPGLASLLALCDPTNTKFYEHGPGNQEFLSKGRDVFITFRGRTVAEVPTVVIDDWGTFVNMSVRNREVGTSFGVYDPYPGKPRYTSARCNTLVFNMDDDVTGGWAEIGLMHVLRHCGVFEGMGYTRKLTEFCQYLNDNKASIDTTLGQHLILPVIRRNAKGDYEPCGLIGDMEIPNLTVGAIATIVDGFIDRVDGDRTIRANLNTGAAIMKKLSTPDFTNPTVLAYLRAVAGGVALSASGLAAASASGALDPAAFTAPRGSEPWGYGTWPGMQTVAGGASSYAASAASFVDSVNKLSQDLQAIFPDSMAFDAGYCPYWLRSSGSAMDDRLCVFVHALLSSNVVPSYVYKSTAAVAPAAGGAATAPTYLASNVDELFSAPGGAAGEFAPLARQLAFAVGSSQEWQALFTGVTSADDKRDALNTSFLAHEMEWAALLGVVINPAEPAAVRGAKLARAFAFNYIADPSGINGPQLSKENGSYEPAIKLFMNTVRYNQGRFGLPPGFTTLNAGVLNAWKYSSETQYRINALGGSSIATPSTSDLTAALDAIANDLTVDVPGAVNTRLFFDSSSYAKLGRFLASQADPKAFLANFPLRPADPNVITRPLGAIDLNDDARAQEFITQLLGLRSEYELATNPMSNMLTLNNETLDLIEKAQNITRREFEAAKDALGAAYGGTRFAEGDQIVERWRAIGTNIKDPLTRALAIMYILQPLTPASLESLVRNDVHLPFEGLGCRPHCKYSCGAVALLQAGIELGALYINGDRAVAGNDHLADIWTLTYSIFYTAMIHDHNLLLVPPDVAVLGYKQGEGVSFRNVATNTGDIYMFMVPYGANKGLCEFGMLNVTQPVNIQGAHSEAFYQDRLSDDVTIDWTKRTYPSAPFYTWLHKLDQLQLTDFLNFTRFSDVRNFEFDNALCPQGAQFHADSSEPNARMTAYKISRDFFGPWVEPADKSLRKLPTNALREAKVPAGVSLYLG